MAQAIDTKPQSVQQRSSASGVFRKLELDRGLRSMSEAELRQALADGTLDDLIDADEQENELEY